LFVHRIIARFDFYGLELSFSGQAKRCSGEV